MNKPVAAYGAFSAWRAQHAAALRASFVRLIKRPFSSLLSLSVMAIALSLPLALGWSLMQLQQLSGSVQNSRAISVFLLPDVTVDQAKALAEPLRSDTSVAAVRIKSPEEGLKDFQNSSELAKAVSMLGKNPLPVVMIIEPRGDESALLDRLKAIPQAEFVQHDAVWQQRLDAWLGFGTRLLGLLALVFALGAVLAVANNVRLDIATRVKEIAVLQQLGATNGYIRRPFLYVGGLLGLLSGALALGLLLIAAHYIQPSLMALISSYGSAFRFVPAPVWAAPLFLVGAVLLGILGAWLAAGHHLRTTRPDDR
jgi:cell division transport system permease protein